MKCFNAVNYTQHKKEVMDTCGSLQNLDFDTNLDIILSNRDNMIYYGMKVVERTARNFSQSERAIGTLNIEDLIQEGYVGLIMAIDKLDIDRVKESSNPSWSFESFIYQRIFGAIRRAIDSKRAGMRMSERKIREVRAGKADERTVKAYFDCIFASLDSKRYKRNKISVDAKDGVKEYDVNFVHSYLLGLINSNLTKDEAAVVTMWYGLDTDKRKGYEIGKQLGMDESSMYRDIARLKDSAMEKLSKKIDSELVVNFLNE